MADEAPYAEVEDILDRSDVSRYQEADELLDHARADGHTLFRVWRFQYSSFRARLASQRGEHDEAAAFAYGALWQAAEDEAGPLLPRHPDVGRVHTDDATINELWRLVDRGVAERFDPLIEDYRSPADGRVQWYWSLIEQLRPNPDIASPRHHETEAARRASQPLLMELRDAGFPAYDIWDLSGWRLPSKKAAKILVKWLPLVADSMARTAIASALTDKKARGVATQPLIDLFRQLPNNGLEKDRVAAAIGTLARDAEYEQIADLVRDPRHGTYRQYMFWAISYMKDPRAVDLCLEFLDDQELGISALRSLGDLRSERARSILQHIASETTTRKRNPEAERQRVRVAVALNGLGKLDRAAAKLNQTQPTTPPPRRWRRR